MNGLLAVAMAYVVAFLSLHVDLVLRPHEVVEALSDVMTSIEAAASVGAASTLIGTDAEPASLYRGPPQASTSAGRLAPP